MSVYSVDFGSKKIKFNLQFSNRKTLGISVLPDSSVIVTAPETSSGDIEKIKSKVRKRAPWILRHQMKFARYLLKQPARQYVSGECHRYLGRQLRLKLSEGIPESVKLEDGYLLVTVPDRGNKLNIEKRIQEWYNERARGFLQKKFDESLAKFKRYKLNEPKFRLRRMTMRWGSCGPSGVILLNPELIKTPSSCIEYVIAHEICHLLHPNHDKKFYKLLFRVMPDWEHRKARLEKVEL